MKRLKSELRINFTFDRENFANSIALKDRFELIVQKNRGTLLLLCNGAIRRYETGEMLCAFTEFQGERIRRLCMELPTFHSKYNTPGMRQTLKDLREVIWQDINPIVAIIVASSLADMDEGLPRDSECRKLFHMYNTCPRIVHNLTSHTRIRQLDEDIIGHRLLVLLDDLNMYYEEYMGLMMTIIGESDDAGEREQLFRMFTEDSLMYNIGYLNVNFNGTSADIYCIRDCLSLFKFEISNCLDRAVHISRCENCDKFYVKKSTSYLASRKVELCSSCIKLLKAESASARNKRKAADRKAETGKKQKKAVKK